MTGSVLVTGGAGYIGSHNARLLLERGYDVIIADNLRTGRLGALPEGARFYKLDLRDGGALARLFAENDVRSVLHFAASSIVPESMRAPLDYFDNNVGGMHSLLSAMLDAGVDRIVFSSTAAVYGQPETMPITEDAPLAPSNPYGESKLMMERMMHWASLAHGMRHVILRYFNVGGAWPGGGLGEDHDPETHLIPLVLRAAMRDGEVSVFGRDYPTPDGTCVRDYIDVMDLAEAHLAALDYLDKGGENLVCNLGNGKGFSVREVIEAAQKASGRKIRTREAGRRPGDPPTLVADATRAERTLGWRPSRDINAILESAWAWHSSHPDGYESPASQPDPQNRQQDR